MSLTLTLSIKYDLGLDLTPILSNFTLMNLFFYSIRKKALKTVKKLFLMVINGGERSGTVGNGEGRDCHNDGRSVTMGHYDSKKVTRR
jgi:hypothetical protein